MSRQYDVGLDPVTWDLPAFTRHITGADLVKQRIRARLLTFAGEWIEDAAVGIPILDWIAQKPPDLDGIEAVVRAEIEAVPGVDRLADVETSFSTSTRTVSMSGTVLLEDDEEGIPVVISSIGSSNQVLALSFVRGPGAIVGG